MKMNRKTKKIASNFVCIVTALSLVFLQTPVSYATAGADEAAQAVASQAEKASQVDELAVQAADDDGQAAEETSKAEAAKAEPAGGADAKATDAADAKKAADAEQAKGDAADKATKAGEDAKPAAEAKPETADGAAKATDAKSDDAKAAGEGETADAAKDASGKEEPKDAAVGDKGKADAGDAAKESASEEDAGKDTAADAKSEAAKDEADAKDDAKGEKAEKPATQRVYTYEDAQLKVTATLDKASAISDDAELKVTAITAKSEDYNYDAYLAALNEDADEEDAFTADNTLLYDVAFLVKDDDGKVVEVQPESGAVKVQFDFKKDQLAKQLDAQEADDVQVVHLPLKDSAKADTTAEATDIAATDVKVEKLDADVNVEDGTLSLKAQEFSAFAVVTLEKGSSDAVTLKFETTEGDAVSGAVPEDYYALASFTVDGVEYANLKKIDSDVLVNGVTYNQQGDNNWYTFVKPSDTNVHFSGHLGSTTNLSVRVVKLAWGGTIDYSTVAWNASNLVDIGPGDSLGQYFVAEFKESDDGKVKTVTLTEPKTAKVNLAFVDSAGEEIAPQLQGKNLYLFAALHFNDGKTGDLYYRTRIEPTDSTTVYSIEQFTDGNGNNPAKLVDGRTFEAFIVTDQTGEPSLNDCLRAFKNQSTKTSGNVTLYDGTINDVIAGQSATYLVDNVAGSANAPANITLTKAPSVDTTISVFDRDGSTSYTVQDADISGYKFYAVAALVNKGEDKNSTPTAWAIVPVDFSGKTSVDLSFVDFYKYDEDGASTSETIAYDPSKYDVGGQRGISIFRTTSNDAVSTYKQLMDMVDAGTISDQPVDGFEWKGNTSLVENPSSIMLKRSYEKVLQVKLDFNDEGKILSDSDNLYLFIKVKHQSGADSYFFQGITSAEAGDITIRVPNWQDNNGDAKDDKFTGNESTIEVKLLKGKQGLNMNNAISGTDCSVVTEGSVAEGYTVHYDFTSDPKDAEENTVDSERTIYYTKVIELTKVNATNDYTFRSILGPAIGYGITADRLEQGSSDFQSNFAVNNYHDNGIGVNPDLSGGSSGALAIGNYVTYNSDAGTVASIDPDGKVFIGQSHSGDLLLYTDSADRVRDARDWVYTIVYSPDEVAEKIVEPSIAHMQKISAELAAHSANITPSKTTDKATIDTTDYPDDATIYVDADALDAVYGSFSGGTTLNIVKKENQTIVFNFKGMETVNVGQYVVTIYDSDGNVKWDEKNSEPNTGNAHGDANHQNTLVDELCKTIIWNLASATDVTIEQTAGTFLLPKSNSKTLVEKTSTGWIVSDGYVYNKGEWHFAWADLNQVDVAELNASKTIGGKVPTGTQKFEFSFEHWNKANKDWILLKDVKNDGSSVTWRTVNESDGKSELNDGWNVYKISEKRKSEGTLGEFALDENTYYAVVKYTTTENASGTTAVASLPVYYKTFNSAAFDANAKSATEFMSGAVSSITFVNEEEEGDLELKKAVEGSEDTTTKFTFEIKVEQPAPTEADANATKALSGVYKAEVATEGATGNPETVNIEFANGYGYIELTAGQTATIKGLPAGSTYTVKETKVGGKTLPSGGSVDQWSVKSVSVDEQNVSGVIGSGTIVKDKTSEVGFVNAFADNTEGSLRITKNATVNGEDPTDANKSAASGTFTFKVKGPGSEGQEQTVTIALKNGVSSTATVDYLAPGEYTVEEINLPSDATLAEGIENPQTVTVVAGNETGIPTAEFTNNFTWDEYEATGNVTLGGTKVIDSRAWTAEDEFAFSVTEVTDATGETAKVNGYTDSATASLANAGMTSAAAGAEVGWSFPTINYTLDDLGTHYYKVVETSTNGDGITVDTDSYIVTVTVADETRDGELEIIKSENYDSLAFTNAYSADGSFTITGVTKALTGRAAGENETFTFVVKETDAEWNVIPGKEPVATGTVSGTGAVTFNPISFRLDANTHDTGTHYYAVSEVGTDGGGLTYDKSVEKFSVEVKDDRKGNLTVNNQKDAQVNLNKTFTNRYMANGKIQLKATKQLEGRSLTAEDEGKFTFELSGPKLGADGANGTITATNGEGGVAAYAEIAFTEEDLKDGNSYLDSKEFTYTIREVVPADSDKVKGVTYDTSEKTVTVTVSDPNHDGKLVVTPAYPEGGATFTNTYNAKGSVTLEGAKSITGRSFKAGDSATMQIEATGDNADKAPMPKVDGQVKDTVKVEPTGGTEVEFAFGEIAYSLSDIPEGETSETFTYKVTESAYTMEGVAQKDSAEYTVEVTISDSEAHDGTLRIEVSGNERGLNFTNAYDATGSVTLSGAKSITGRDFKTGDSATMKIEAVTQGAPMPKVDGQVKDTVTVEPTSGTEVAFAFGEIAYSLSDIPEGKTSETFTYKVTESAYTMAGVAQKDSTEYTVTITISDKGDGKLGIDASDNATGLNFTNKYAASDSLTLGGTKTIDKREIAPDDTFGFEVKEGDRVVSHGVAEGTSVITYDAIKYTLADVGEHEYVVSETQCDAAGVTKSNATLTFKVKVSDNGDGTLKVETLDGEPEKLSFTNAYSATGELKLSGKKAIENKPANASLAGYTFTVKEGDTTVATGESDANGNITFDKIIYTEADAGTHTYVVAEDGAGTAKDGVTNTQDTVTVVVDVADDGKGQMTATTAETSPAKIDAVNFTNTYAATGSITFEGVKKLENATLTAGKFGFNVSESNTVLARVTHDADGKIAYPTINYALDDVGTHTYTVKETSEGGNGITVDNATHTVTVKVSDNGDGTLKVEPSDNYTKLDFTNSYDASGTATLEVAKALATGDEWPEGKSAEFTLAAAAQTEGAPMPAEDGAKVSLSAVGMAEFGTITYPLSSAGKTYNYTITETAWTGWTNNGDIKVVVEVDPDNGTGKLGTHVSYEPGDFTITNTMKRTSASVKKVWDDAENQDGKRPASLTVALKADGETVKTVELSDANKWTATVDDLPEYAGEKKIAYTWAEEKVPSGYTLSGPSTEGALTTLTNTHATEKVEVGITKKWEDADNQDGKRPEDITVNLFANGKKVATQQVKANDQGEWTYMFTNLDKYYDDGKLVEYTVSEEGVKDYTLVNIPLTGETIAVDENGKVILVNRHDTETTDVSVKKVWNDFDDKNKQRPANLTLALTANGAATDKTVVLSEGDGWQAELTGLDKYAKGEAITYSWTETDLPEGYTLSSAAQDGKVTTPTNTFTAVGKLTFTKTVSGGVSQEEADGALVFQVQKLDGEGNVVGYLDKDGILRAEETDITIKDGEFDASTGDDGILEYIKTFENIALGNYKVIETNAEIEGYRFEQDDSVTETETISVMDDSAAAKLTDVYTEIGNLTFTKTVAGGVSKEEADGALKFVVAKVDDDGKVLGYLDKDGNLVDEEVELTISNGFVTADGGKTYAKTFTGIDAGKYTVTETNAAIEGYHFNEKHSITDGKTTVSKDAAGAASLTDVYDAGTSIPLAGKKSYTDVAGNALDMPVGMFEFTLVEVDADGNALEGAAAYSQTVGNAADGSISFDAIDYTKEGAHYYQVSEVNGGKTIDGVTYSDTVHDITVVVADDPDTGELVASITPEDLSLDFANGYRAADVDVVLNAQKAYVDSKTGAKQAIEDGKFEFILMRADETEGDPEVYTAKVGANGKAAFEAITFTAEMLDGAKQKTFSYDMSEVVPDTAEKVFQDGKETGWWMDNDVLYDGSTHAVEITVTDDGSGQLTATVEYDKGKAATAIGPTFTNQHVSASETLKFTKYYYGGDLVDFQEFSFVLEAVKDVNEDAGTYVVRGETELDVPEGGEIADDGVRPFTIETVVAAETFHKATQADVGFPAIRFVNDGTYYYVVYEGAIDYIEELAEDEQPIAEDSAQYLIRVDVKNGKVASTKYWLLYEGDVFEVNPGSGSDELAFYNNSTGVVDFDDSGSHGYVDDGAITSVYPRAQKLVNGETLAIAKNQFTFELLDEDGTVLATSTNDDNGDVAFFDKDTQPGLEFDEPGVYTYQIREVVPPKSERLPGVTYDTSVTTLTVDVVRESMPNDTGNGTVYALEATTAYAGPNQPQDMSADYAIFNNLMEGIDVRVQKLDADTGEGLAGCEYGLWMKTSSGDVCLATAESGADGWITFEGADVLPGYQYYFKEVSAPSGYVLDPYRSDLFELSYDSASGEYSLVSAE